MSEFTNLVEIAPSIVTAVLFAVFAYKLIYDQRIFAQRMMDDWGKRMAERDILWKDTLLENQRLHSDGMARLAEETKSNTRQIVVLQGLITEHDRGLQEVMPKLREALYTKE